jgi:hypothetical protein
MLGWSGAMVWERVFETIIIITCKFYQVIDRFMYIFEVFINC